MVSKTTFKIRLDALADPDDLRELSSSDKDAIKQEIAEFAIDKILEDVSKSKSPVDNSKFKALNKDYKKEKSKIAMPVPNLELHGDMLDALSSEPYRAGVEVGIFDYDQAQKSDNHNKFSAKSKRTKVPQRQFIPKKGEQLRPGIMRQLKTVARQMIEELKDE